MGGIITPIDQLRWIFPQGKMRTLEIIVTVQLDLTFAKDDYYSEPVDGVPVRDDCNSGSVDGDIFCID